MERAEFQASSLLLPFAAGSPVGVDPRGDRSPSSFYSRLRDARADARATERQMDYEGAISLAQVQWKLVETNARVILADLGKDLEVSAWLAEACVRLHGLNGLRFATEVMLGLVSQFWSSGLFPHGDDEGGDPRAAPIAGLNGISGDGTLLQPLRMVVLFHGADRTPVTLWAYEQAEEAESIGEAARKKRKMGIGALLAELDAEARLAGAAALQETGRQARAALARWQELAAALEARLGRDAPPSSRVASVLDKIARIAERLVPEPAGEAKLAAEAAFIPPATQAMSAEGERVDAPHHARPEREEMLCTLLLVADYFRRYEPHSPLAYALDEAVRRGRLSFLDLLKEVVPEGEQRGMILLQLGIRASPD